MEDYLYVLELWSSESASFQMASSSLLAMYGASKSSDWIEIISQSSSHIKGVVLVSDIASIVSFVSFSSDSSYSG